MNTSNFHTLKGLFWVLPVICAWVFTSCATVPVFNPSAYSAANPRAIESRPAEISLGVDAVTRTSIRQLESQPAAAPMREGMPGMKGMDHGQMNDMNKAPGKMDHSTMPGMDHGQPEKSQMKSSEPMPGMSHDPAKQDSSNPKGQMDHSGMKSMDQKNSNGSSPKEMMPAGKQRTLDEMKKLSDEMKEASDAFKALSDVSTANQTNSTKKAHQ